MADLLPTGVTINRAWTEGQVNGKRHTAMDVTMNLVAQGTASAGSLIPASAFGLREFIEAGPMCNTSNNTCFTFVVGGGNRAILLSFGPLDSEGGAPQQRTGVFRGIIRGFKAQ